MVQCYYKSGNPALTKAAPCNLTAVAHGEHTSCCAPDELCMNNGLCRNATSTPRTNFYWRGGCTDPTFQDPSCPDYCNLKNSWEDQLVWQCADDAWCCNNGGAAPEEQRYDRTNLTCCTISEYTFSAASPSLIATATYLGEVFTVAGTAGSTSSTTAGSSSTASSSEVMSTSQTGLVQTSTSSPSATGTSNVEPTAKSSSSKTSSVAIGVGVGVGVFALAVCAIGFWLWRKKKRGTAQRGGSRSYQPAELMAPDHRIEKPAEKYRSELMATAEPHELSGSPIR